MTVVDTLMNAVSRPNFGNTPTMETLSDIAPSEERSLRSALRTVEEQFELSEAVEKQAEAELMDEKLRSSFDAEFSADFAANESDEGQACYIGEGSARILELKDKQEACKEIHNSILQGTTLLKSLADRANQLSAYLEKSEIELQQLEAVETQSSNLKEAANNLTSKHHEMKSTIEEQKQQISLLEGHRTSSRDAVEKARMEISGLIDKQEAFENEINNQKAARVRLENDKIALLEKIELLERSNANMVAETEVAQGSNQELMLASQRKDMDLAKGKSKLNEMDQTIERLRVDLADIRAKHENMSGSYISNKTRLDETLFLIESERREHEEKMCRKEKKLAELEVQNQVLTRQNSLNEDIISELNNKTAAENTSSDPGAMGPRMPKLELAHDSSKVAG